MSAHSSAPPIDFGRRVVGAAPLLLASRRGGPRPAPTVLWFHGLGADKDVHEKELRALAELGFLAVGVDAAGHGERRLPDLEARIAAPRAASLRTAVALSAATAAEVPTIVAALVASGDADPRRVAVVGVSMGAYVVYRAIVATPGLAAAVAILGSPAWPHPASPHDRTDALGAVALLSITAERDENVPPAAARALHERLERDAARRRPHRYIELPGAVHLMAAEDWAVVIRETHAWLLSHLR